MIQTNFTEILPFCLYWHVLKLLFRFVVCVSVPTKMLNKLVLIRKISPCTYIVCVSKVQFSYRRNMFPWTPLSEISNDSILKLQSSNRDLSGKREVWGVERTFGSSVELKDEERSLAPCEMFCMMIISLLKTEFHWRTKLPFWLSNYPPQSPLMKHILTSLMLQRWRKILIKKWSYTSASNLEIPNLRRKVN